MSTHSPLRRILVRYVAMFSPLTWLTNCATVMPSHSLALVLSCSHCTPAARACATLCPCGQRRRDPNLLASGVAACFLVLRDCIASMILMVNALMPQLPSLLVVSSSTILFTASNSCKDVGHEEIGSQVAFRGMRPGW